MPQPPPAPGTDESSVPANVAPHVNKAARPLGILAPLHDEGIGTDTEEAMSQETVVRVRPSIRNGVGGQHG